MSYPSADDLERIHWHCAPFAMTTDSSAVGWTRSGTGSRWPAVPLSVDFRWCPVTSGKRGKSRENPRKLVDKRRFVVRQRPRQFAYGWRVLRAFLGPIEKAERRGPQSSRISRDNGCENDVVGPRPVLLWRDAGGQVRALADRCPRRLAPLSRGKSSRVLSAVAITDLLSMTVTGECVHNPRDNR
jgi:nitrite reductase/ring-hydroxylating ferredoxin subunit